MDIRPYSKKLKLMVVFIAEGAFMFRFVCPVRIFLCHKLTNNNNKKKKKKKKKNSRFGT